jgi:DNA-binding MltR family transcriptional regulator
MSKKIKIATRHIELPKPYFVHAMAEIKAQTPRGAAIAGTALLDLLLRTAIESLMRQDQEIQNLLFENRGALQDFSARIQVAFAFKIIGSGAYLDLCILRDIRNAFAHSAEAFDFERPDIAEKCKALWYPHHVRYEKWPETETSRDTYTLAVMLLADGLTEYVPPTPGQIPRPSTFMQLGPPWPLPASRKKQKIRPSRGGPARNKKTDQ